MLKTRHLAVGAFDAHAKFSFADGLAVFVQQVTVQYQIGRQPIQRRQQGDGRGLILQSLFTEPPEQRNTQQNLQHAINNGGPEAVRTGGQLTGNTLRRSRGSNGGVGRALGRLRGWHCLAGRQ